MSPYQISVLNSDGLSGNALVLINIAALRRARLVLGWVTVRGYNILVFNQATQAYSAWPSLRGQVQ